MSSTARTRRTLGLALALALAPGCAGAHPAEAGPADHTRASPPPPPPPSTGPDPGEQCFTPEVSRRGGLAPAPPQEPGPRPESAGDEHGCAPYQTVFDTCCCGARAGPRFDGERCCYVIEPCGCC